MYAASYLLQGSQCGPGTCQTTQSYCPPSLSFPRVLGCLVRRLPFADKDSVTVTEGCFTKLCTGRAEGLSELRFWLPLGISPRPLRPP